MLTSREMPLVKYILLTNIHVCNDRLIIDATATQQAAPLKPDRPDTLSGQFSQNQQL